MRASGGLLLGACCMVLLAPAAAQSDAERARMAYEQQQREYWRAQEAARVAEAQRQERDRLDRERREREDAGAFRMGKPQDGGGSGGGSGGFAGSSRDGSAAADVEKARRRLEREPPLSPAKNPLLGQWRLEKAAAPKGGLGELMGMIAGGACQALFGDGIWDFRPKAMHGIDRGIGETELDKVEYRGDAQRVAVLPQRMFRLLMFEFESPSRVRFVGQDCVMVRVGGAASTGGDGAPGGGRGGATLAAAPGERPAGATGAEERPPPEVCRRMLIDRLGAAREPEVRQALQARFREILPGTVPGTGHLRLDARGSACDDPRVKAVLYDFDAAGLLRSLTLVWGRPPGPQPAPIFVERAEALGTLHGLAPPHSPSRLSGTSPTARIVLQDLPERNLLLEAYAAPR